MEFVKWGKIARLHREWEITEKVDGTNGVLWWTEWHEDIDFKQALTSVIVGNDPPRYLFAGSRNRWLTKDGDNYGFARWAWENAYDLTVLGLGRHFGEWFGSGIQRRYGLDRKVFALFDTRWSDSIDDLPPGVDVVPVLGTIDGGYLNTAIQLALDELRLNGSFIVPGFMDPEGIVVRHKQEGSRFKVLLVGDDAPKTAVEPPDLGPWDPDAFRASYGPDA